MDISQLMIGDYVMRYNHMVRVSGLSSDGNFITARFAHGGLVSDEGRHYSGVPLTPEILSKCGFVISNEPNSKNVYLKYIGLRVFSIASDFSTQFPVPFYEVNKFGMVHELSKVSHLHELQRLVLSLTGSKLDVNL